MRSKSDTIARLRRLRSLRPASPAAVDRLSDLAGFGSNPGALRARYYRPSHLPPHAPLVVVLHGCTQTAAGYDAGSGWSTLADRHGFALLFPEQQRANNANLCFNWFEPGDTVRGGGEALSIRQMIDHAVAADGLDAGRVFVTGLSAGGAMAAAMLAAYPEVFAGGAVIAGLPYGVAASVPEAFDRMRGHGLPSERALQQRLRAASPHAGPWPKLSVWHGSADLTVSPANGEAVVAQWLAAHSLPSRPTRIETVDGHRRRVWCDDAGREMVEAFVIDGLGHGTPLNTAGPDGYGTASPFMLEAGISSTLHIARFWGLVPRGGMAAADGVRSAGKEAGKRDAQAEELGAGAAPMESLPAEPARRDKTAASGTGVRPGTAGREIEVVPKRAEGAPPRAGIREQEPSPAAAPPSRIQSIIEDAFRKAGLM